MIHQAIQIKDLEINKQEAIRHFVDNQVIPQPTSVEILQNGFSKPLKLNFKDGKILFLKSLRDNSLISEFTPKIIGALHNKILNKKTEPLFLNILSQEKINGKYWQILNFENFTKTRIDRCLSKIEISNFVKILANIHAATHKLSLDYKDANSLDILLQRIDRRIESVTRQNKNHAGFLLAQRDLIISELMDLNYPKGFQVDFYHGDIHKRNASWIEIDGYIFIEKLFDYEFTLAAKALDLIMPIIDILGNFNWYKQVPSSKLLLSKKFIYFLKHYQIYEELNLKEIESIPIFLKFHLLIFYTLKLEDNNYLDKVKAELKILNSKVFKSEYAEKIMTVIN